MRNEKCIPHDPFATGTAVSRRKCLLFAVPVLCRDLELLKRIILPADPPYRNLPEDLDRVRDAIDAIECAADGQSNPEEEDEVRESLTLAKESAVLDQDFDTAVYFRDVQYILLRTHPRSFDPYPREPDYHVRAAQALRLGRLAGHWSLHQPPNRAREERAAEEQKEIYSQYLADVFGPFPSSLFSPEWRTDTAVSLARMMYESREFGAMPILADALQDAGCDTADILDHCRGDGPHVRGCWVVDLVLGKE